MYELKRRDNKIREDLKMGDEVIAIEIDPEAVARNVRRAQVEIIEAQSAIKKTQGAGTEAEPYLAALEQYGVAVIELLAALWGEDITKRMLDYYEGNYVEMSTEVLPFVFGVILPQVEAGIKGMREREKSNYMTRKRAGTAGDHRFSRLGKRDRG